VIIEEGPLAGRPDGWPIRCLDCGGGAPTIVPVVAGQCVTGGCYVLDAGRWRWVVDAVSSGCRVLVELGEPLT